MTRQWCGQDHEHQCFVAFDVCGCIGAVSVLTHREVEAYRFAADETKSGFRVELMSADAFRALPMKCGDHPDGPPWWESNGGRGKRPATWAPTVGMGL